MVEDQIPATSVPTITAPIDPNVTLCDGFTSGYVPDCEINTTFIGSYGKILK